MEENIKACLKNIIKMQFQSTHSSLIPFDGIIINFDDF